MAKYGQKAVVRYKGTLDDGTVFDSTDGKEPLEFELGSGMIIHGFDEAVLSMEPGEKKTVHIPCKEAYGEWSEERVEKAPMYSIPDAKELKVGKRFYFIQEGCYFPAVITEIVGGIATVDFNNPLAGKDLNFEIELIELKD